MQAIANLDPTGTLSAATAAISLVGAVLRVAPAVKNLKNSSGGNAGRTVTSPTGGPATLHRADTVTQGVAPAPKDPERERRAYETVNYVLREIGSRLCAAGLVDEHALTRALTAAAQHVEVRLFSGEANRLFESLAPRLADPILVNSVFTSIYLIGALTAELRSSLPNYKTNYPNLGPWLVQQIFRAAIGEDAFRDNLSANLDAYHTLAATAGLLRPTDIGYHTFPKFPAFRASRYSSRSFSDVRSNKNVYEKLVKYFDKVGFPQPTPARLAEVGPIKDWCFLSGDFNSHNFDVDKADKNIGENFGKVLHWIICSAERIPPGQAVICYYDHHIELVKWIGHRMGNAVLYPAWDLNMSGAHTQMDPKIKAFLFSWVIIMASEPAQAAKRNASEQWMQSRIQTAAQVSALASQRAPERSASQSGQQPAPPAQPQVTSVDPTTGAPVSNDAPPTSPNLHHAPETVPGNAAPPPDPNFVKEQLEGLCRYFNDVLLPSSQRLLFNLPIDLTVRERECHGKISAIEKELIFKLDALELSDDEASRIRRKDTIMQAQSLVDSFVTAMTPRPEMQANMHHRPASVSFPAGSVGSSPSASGSPPPYTPGSVESNTSGRIQGYPFPPAQTIRRKAPPPPKKLMTAKALYDFEADPQNPEEVDFKEGDEIEIVEKTAVLEAEGWCRGRVKGQKKLGLMPLDYLEIEVKKPPVAAPTQSVPRPPIHHAATVPLIGPEKPHLDHNAHVHSIPELTELPSQLSLNELNTHLPSVHGHPNSNAPPVLQQMHQLPQVAGPAHNDPQMTANQHLHQANHPQYASHPASSPTEVQGHYIPQHAQIPHDMNVHHSGGANAEYFQGSQSISSHSGLTQSLPNEPAHHFPSNQTGTQPVHPGGPQMHGFPHSQPPNPNFVPAFSNHPPQATNEGSKIGVVDAVSLGITGVGVASAFSPAASQPVTGQTEATTYVTDTDIVQNDNSSNIAAINTNQDVNAETVVEAEVDSPDALPIDLSSFEGPTFDPQPAPSASSFQPTFVPEPAFITSDSDLGTTDVSNAVTDPTTATEQTTTIDTSDTQTGALTTTDTQSIGISPFAALATPSTVQPVSSVDNTTISTTVDSTDVSYDSTTFVQDQYSTATKTSQQDTYSTTSGTDQTQWDSVSVSDDTSYDLDY